MKNYMKKYSLADRELFPELHRALWMWLAEHPEADKEDWFAKFWEGREPDSLCFACEADLSNYCRNCPLGEFEIGCKQDDDGLFPQWHNAQDMHVRAGLAREIANLPWGDGR